MKNVSGVLRPVLFLLWGASAAASLTYAAPRTGLSFEGNVLILATAYVVSEGLLDSKTLNSLLPRITFLAVYLYLFYRLFIESLTDGTALVLPTVALIFLVYTGISLRLMHSKLVARQA